MFEISNLLLFVVTSFLLCLSPGPDNIYVLTQGITNGKKAAIVTTLGLASGLIFHTIAATFGIAIIFKTSQLAFDIVKYAGALYLLYIAYMIFKHRDEKIDITSQNKSLDLKKLYIRGLIMNILNPKVSIFFLAFLPQFVNTTESVTFQMISFGLIFMMLTIVVFSSIGILGNKLRNKIAKKNNFLKYMNIITSLVLVVLSINLAFSHR